MLHKEIDKNRFIYECSYVTVLNSLTIPEKLWQINWPKAKLIFFYYKITQIAQ